MLTFDMLKYHMDAVVDDINTALNAKFPVFSDFNNTTYPTKYPNYDFIPEKYIRSVIVVGSASKFYTTDEEGVGAALSYDKEYAQNLFYMLRDYADQVPVEFQADNQGYLTTPEKDPEDYDYDNTSAFML